MVKDAYEQAKARTRRQSTPALKALLAKRGYLNEWGRRNVRTELIRRGAIRRKRRYISPFGFSGRGIFG